MCTRFMKYLIISITIINKTNNLFRSYINNINISSILLGIWFILLFLKLENFYPPFLTGFILNFINLKNV